SQPLADLTPLFDRVPPATLRDVLLGHPIVTGYEPLGSRVLKPSPLRPADEQEFAGLFPALLDGLAAANQMLTERGRYLLGPTHIDLSSPAAATALAPHGTMSFALGSNVVSTRIAIRYLMPQPRWETVLGIEPEITNNTIRFPLPETGQEPPNWLRRILEL